MATKKSEALSELLVAVADALLARGKKGPGLVVEKFGAITVKLNATKEESEGIPPFHAVIFDDEFSDLFPLALINPSAGVISRGGKTESELIEFFRGQK